MKNFSQEQKRWYLWKSWLHYSLPVQTVRERRGKKEKVLDVVKDCLKKASYMNEQKKYKISSEKKSQ